MSLAHPVLASRRPARPLSGDVRLPGDKALGHHALLLAALATGESQITGLPEHGDVLRMASTLRALGAEIIQAAPGSWRVAGRGVGGLREPASVLDVGNSGIAARLICGALASHDLFATVTGSAALRRRPMRWLTNMLQGCGARFQCPADAWLPLAVQGARSAVPFEHRLSMQTAPGKSALLLAGLNAPGWTRITEPAPTCDHVMRLLRHFGASVTVEPYGDGCTTSVMGQPELQAVDLTVPGDPSLAAFPLVAALIVPDSAVTVRGVAMGPRCAGLFATLRDMGAQLELTRERLESGGPVADVTASYTGLRGTDVRAARAGSMARDYPILAVAAACAAGPTRFARLRTEGGSLSATLAMLRLSGVQVDEERDGFVVHGVGAAPAGGVRVDVGVAPHVALCGLVLSLATAAPVRMDETTEIEEEFPGILALLRQSGAPLP
jgi:3-phosphoshikimate 1-carboxyvinyltransferase